MSAVSYATAIASWNVATIAAADGLRPDTGSVSPFMRAASSTTGGDSVDSLQSLRGL